MEKFKILAMVIGIPLSVPVIFGLHQYIGPHEEGRDYLRHLKKSYRKIMNRPPAVAVTGRNSDEIAKIQQKIKEDSRVFLVDYNEKYPVHDSLIIVEKDPSDDPSHDCSNVFRILTKLIGDECYPYGFRNKFEKVCVLIPDDEETNPRELYWKYYDTLHFGRVNLNWISPIGPLYKNFQVNSSFASSIDFIIYGKFRNDVEIDIESKPKTSS